MKLSDLKTGMIVTTREGNEYVVFKDAVCTNKYDCGDVLVNEKKSSWHRLDSFDEEMKHKDGGRYKEFDIMKVEITKHPYGYMNLGNYIENREVLWKREDALEVTMADIEKKFGCKVKIVKED